MPAKSHDRGHKIIWRNNQWVYANTGEPLNYKPCKFCKRQTENVLVKIPADLSCTGFSKFKYVAIDACIAPIIEALQKGAIDMRGSCCGHGRAIGEIHLQDGRVLLIADYKKFDKHRKEINKLLK